MQLKFNFSGQPSIVIYIITCLRLVVLWEFVLSLRRRTLHFKHLDTFSISQKKYILSSLYSFPYGLVLLPVWRGPYSGRGICNPRLSCFSLCWSVFCSNFLNFIPFTGCRIGIFYFQFNFYVFFLKLNALFMSNCAIFA